MVGIKTIHDADALLLFKVGPVYCCSPTMPVVSVQMPPRLNHPPGSTPAQPGMFKYATGLVRVVDLRKRFGVDEGDWQHPGRIVVVEVEGGLAGFWVDEIIDVIQFPESGWGAVPALVPRTVFSRTLLFNDQIQLYADFDKLNEFRETGYLRQHIQALKARLQKKTAAEQTQVRSASSAQPATGKSGEPVDEGKNAIQKSGSASHDELKVAPSEQHTAEQTAAMRMPDITANRQPAVTPSVPVEKPSARPAGNTGKNQSTILDKRVGDAEAKALPYSKTGKQPHSTATTERQPVTTAAAKHRPVTAKPIIDSHEDKPLSKSAVPAPDQQPMAYQKNEPAGSANDNSAWYLLALLLSGIALGVYLYSDVFFATEQTVDDYKPVTRPAMPRIVQELAEDLQPEKAAEMASDALNVESTSADVKITLGEKSTNENVDSSQAAADAMTTLETGNEGSVETMAPPPAADDEIAHMMDSAQDAYHASIDRDEQGVVIILNQPDEYYPEETVQAVNGDTGAAITDQHSDQQLQLVPAGTETGASSPENYSTEEKAAPAVVVTVNAEQQNVPMVVTEKTIIHIVVKGDTLWHIAKRYINNPYRYPELARLSRIKNPDLIYPGNRVKIIINRKAGSKKSANRKPPSSSP